MGIWNYSKGPSWKRSRKSQKERLSAPSKGRICKNLNICAAFISDDRTTDAGVKANYWAESGPSTSGIKLASGGKRSRREVGVLHPGLEDRSEGDLYSDKGGSTKRTQEGRPASKSKTVVEGGRFASGARERRSDSRRGDEGSGLQFGGGRTGPRSGGRESELRKWSGGSSLRPWLGIPNHTAEEENPGLGLGMGTTAPVGEFDDLFPVRGIVGPNTT
ncbi:hypothetical protein JTB14_005691 [Gonioctena quinquepunctata]|nr:hypothetical protein JTB14_005691 [Gonioctena quinquepunctata]